jgi:hypothetical protein
LPSQVAHRRDSIANSGRMKVGVNSDDQITYAKEQTRCSNPFQ